MLPLVGFRIIDVSLCLCAQNSYDGLLVPVFPNQEQQCPNRAFRADEDRSHTGACVACDG